MEQAVEFSSTNYSDFLSLWLTFTPTTITLPEMFFFSVILFLLEMIQSQVDAAFQHFSWPQFLVIQSAFYFCFSYSLSNLFGDMTLIQSSHLQFKTIFISAVTDNLVCYANSHLKFGKKKFQPREIYIHKPDNLQIAQLRDGPWP